MKRSARGSMLAGLFSVLWAGCSPAADEPQSVAACDLEQSGPARVVEVVDGDTVVLRDGREVRLVGIQAPKLPLGRPDFEIWPMADEAKDALETLVLGKQVTLAHGGRAKDRHGRVLAHLHLAEGGETGTREWVQGAMLEAGFARVYTFPDNRSCVPALLAREAVARAARTGIWTDPYYQIRAARPFDGADGRYELVEGRVVAVGEGRGRVYLNFGENWRDDFTVVIDREALALFEETGLDPDHLEGRRVRVRGWLRSWNGPMIDATHPEQIEILR